MFSSKHGTTRPRRPLSRRSTVVGDRQLAGSTTDQRKNHRLVTQQKLVLLKMLLGSLLHNIKIFYFIFLICRK